MNQPRKTIIVPAGTARPNVGLLLNFNQERRGGLAVELLLVMEKKEGRSYQRIPLSGNHKAYLQGLPAALAHVVMKLADEALVEHLVRSGFAWLRDADKPFELLDERHYVLLRQWTSEVLQELKPLVPVVKYLFYLPVGEPFHSTRIRPASISAASPAMQWVLERRGGLLHLFCSVAINNGVFPVEDFAVTPYFLKSGNEFFLLKPADRELLERYRQGEFVVREEGLPRFMATVVGPLAERYPVNTDAVILTESVDVQPQPQVYVSELNENFLLIKPKWSYAGHEVEESEEEETRVEYEDRLVLIARKKEEELVLMNALKGLHSKFEGQSNGYFYLNFKEALEKSWFLRFYQLMQQMDVPVLGMNKLRKFKYNTNVPSFEIVAGRGIDWFDLTIRVSYGDLVVPLHELRKAILGRQEFILLSDGSLGMLPKEWLDKYALLLKMGQPQEGGIRLPALHWGILSELSGSGGGLAGAVVDEGLQAELEEKRRRWANYAGGALGDGVLASAGGDGASGGALAGADGASGGAARGADGASGGSGGAAGGGALAGSRWVVPAAVQAQLRDYQVAGFRWMCLLNEMGWGGCLADDMGLGKTLQTLSFLQHVVELHPDETHLVVCPTSLLYNWETELRKFLPGLDYHLHYGADRVLDETVFRRAHVIITSYGMVRNDVQHFASFTFGYVILDESQAIKNPASQVRKAVMQLRGRNRLALSGTPVQNNTFDLYAQMDFLNPGMLGSADFFRTEFASPIDRNGDPVAAARLRKLIYPFILRRTKEQVAKDLPDRTVMILWCEMGEEQRRIYDSYRRHYRESLLGRIAEEGMGKSSIYILEGLTKLRQICDSPALLKDLRDGPAAVGADGRGTGTAGEPDGLAAAGDPDVLATAAGVPDVLATAAGVPGRLLANEAGGPDNPVPNVSVKLEELVREIEENTGAQYAAAGVLPGKIDAGAGPVNDGPSANGPTVHKVLVFSQFTSMLGLIREALDARGIRYLYLDGSVKAEDRKAGVAQFQEDDTMRVFLISLKAGGVGLTLTAADYVYLVDPWWNPAAEQQAIDRSHRIGQVNKVFAYRMICKDTVEEKILQLQEKKRSLAADLVADEAGFVKHLSQDDVAFLFG